MKQIVGEMWLRGINNKYWDKLIFVLSVRSDSLPALEAIRQTTGLFYMNLWMDKSVLRTFLEMIRRRRFFRASGGGRADVHSQ
jgi:hypothetical protein